MTFEEQLKKTGDVEKLRLLSLGGEKDLEIHASCLQILRVVRCKKD